jgi:hypothetical protein
MDGDGARRIFSRADVLLFWFLLFPVTLMLERFGVFCACAMLAGYISAVRWLFLVVEGLTDVPPRKHDFRWRMGSLAQSKRVEI